MVWQCSFPNPVGSREVFYSFKLLEEGEGGQHPVVAGMSGCQYNFEHVHYFSDRNSQANEEAEGIIDPYG
jgi:hypothetical protein